MEKTDLAKQFSARLHEAMITAGYKSQRSISGVDIHKLVEITGHSPQICRRYLRGEAIPEPVKLVELSSKLNVSPGWLLFGDHHDAAHKENKKITISKNLLHYIFAHARELYNAEQSSDECSDFLLDLARDVSQINTDEEQSKKIIDLALASVRHFRTF
jgi:hypothetical protein